MARRLHTRRRAIQKAVESDTALMTETNIILKEIQNRKRTDRRWCAREAKGTQRRIVRGGIAALMAKHAKKKEMSFYSVPIE